MNPRAWLLFGGVSVIWGCRTSSSRWPSTRACRRRSWPGRGWLWGRRCCALAWRRGALAGLGDRRRAIAAYTVCEVAVPFLLIALGERYVSRRWPRS